jgi:diguanylate cyclase (GGDEF)-like protein
MNVKDIKINIIFFALFYLFIILVSSFISYKFFITGFIELEDKQNKNNINTLLNSMNKNMEVIRNNTNDYAKWDDSYNFLNHTHQNYIYENFREGSTAIKDLNLDFIIFSTLQHHPFYSKYENSFLQKHQKSFESALIHSFEKTPRINTIFHYNSHYLYISKETISNTDSTKEPNGYIFMGRVISNEELNLSTNIFEKIYLSNKYSQNETTLSFNYPYLSQVRVAIIKSETQLKNCIQIFDHENTYLFSIITQNKREIVNNGKNAILVFNVIFSVFLFIILWVIYNHQKNLQKHNKLLESKVKRRTNQLTRSLQKLQNKNAELYTLANKDHLTKISNRRNYFIESEALLNQAIKENLPLCVIIIDIDKFKHINDTYGHAIGDKILIAFCDIVNEIIEKETVFGRIGGEEFCLTFKNKTLDETQIIGEKIRQKCENAVLHINEHKIKFTISLGLSDKKEYQHIDEILQHADELLYSAKNSGRNKMIRTSIHKKK